MSTIFTPENIVELLKLFSVAVGSVSIAYVAIKTQAESHSKAIDTLKEFGLSQVQSNDRLAEAIEDLRVTQEKLCTKLGSM